MLQSEAKENVETPTGLAGMLNNYLDKKAPQVNTAVVAEDRGGCEEWLRARGDEYRDLTCPRQREEEVVPAQDGKPEKTMAVYKPYPIWGFSASNFEKFGVGVHMWFHFQQVLCFAFFIFSILAAPAIMYNIAGDQAQGLGLQITTLGNLGNAADVSDVEMPLINKVISKKVMRRYMAYIDAAMCGLFLLIIIKLQRRQKSAKEEYDRHVVSVTQYAIQVAKLPKDSTVEEVEAFFRRYGEIVDCVMAYDDVYLLETYAARGRLKKQIQTATIKKDEKELQDLNKKVEKLDKKIEKVQAKRQAANFQRKAVCAFVTFENIESVSAALADYPDGTWSRLFMDETLRFRGKAIRVVRAQEPSNIRFQNLQYGKCNKILRRCVSLLVNTVFLSFTVVVVYLSLTYQRRLPKEEECPVDTITKAAAEADDTLVGCYCRQNQNAWNERRFCAHWLRDYVKSQLLVQGAGVAITVVNFLLTAIVRFLVSFEKHASVSKEQTAITRKLFLSMFLNTAIITLAVNAKYGKIFQGDYEDFVPDWYPAVGAAILSSVIMGMLSGNGKAVADWPLGVIKRWAMGKRKKTESEMHQLYAGAPFTLAERNAALLNTVFVVLFYSGGMPILIPVACLSFFLVYWADKITFLRISATPPRFDNQAAAFVCNVLPFSILIHLCLSIWFYTSPTLVDAATEAAESFGGDDYAVGKYHRNGILDRLKYWHVAPLVLALAVLLVYLLIKWGSDALFGSNPFESWCRSSKVAPVPAKITYRQAREVGHFTTYRVHEQPDFVDAFIRTESQRMLMPETKQRELGDKVVDAIAVSNLGKFLGGDFAKRAADISVDKEAAKGNPKLVAEVVRMDHPEISGAETGTSEPASPMAAISSALFGFAKKAPSVMPLPPLDRRSNSTSQNQSDE